MMHAFPRTFALPKQRSEHLLSATAEPLTPFAYLRLRREAANLSIPEAAGILARNADEVAQALDLFHLLDTPGNVARFTETLERVRSVFPFDPDVYRQLATEPADRHPRICRGCGCSHWDPCTDGHHACAWATATACTQCLPDFERVERCQ